MTIILGINAYHGDASAALVIDGKLVAAVEEERFNRIKHWAGFPAESIKWCLETAGIKGKNVDHVAVSFDPRANIAKKITYGLRHPPSLRFIRDRITRQGKTLGIKEEFAKAVGLASGEVIASIHRIEHHQTHVAAGFLISPYEEAAVLSVDSLGDFVSTLSAFGQGNSWKEYDRVYFPHSIGFLYSGITTYLGFPHYGDEYKVMGMAPYGTPEFLDFFRTVIFPKGNSFELNLDYFKHHREGIMTSWANGSPLVQALHSELLEKKLGRMRNPKENLTSKHYNIAKSLQVVTEEIILHLLDDLYKKTKCNNLCMTGGVAMNSVVNGKITSQTGFKHVYIPAGAADNGTSFGSAFYVWNKILGRPRSFVQNHAYWGCESTDMECQTAIEKVGLPYTTLSGVALLDWTVARLLAGNVVGWFQGKMEFGARALGSRSLLADPRRTDMRDIINLRIKFREKFRPFAPSILEENIAEWFELNETAPYMEKVLPIRKEKHNLIPAVTHVDGSGRLQSVSRHTNPLYHALISKFHERTGVPILLNTSLNENEPVVRIPLEAISCFLRTDMDVLVLGTHVIDRNAPGFPARLKTRVVLKPGEVAISAL
jgi:carbamoyltransferase